MYYEKKLKQLREENKYLQKDIACILGISSITYSHYETGDANIPINHLVAIANFFNVSIDYLFNFTSTRQYEIKQREINLKLSGQRIKQIRKEHKLNQNQLGEKLGCSFGTISGYEIGRYIIATPILYDLCFLFKVSADYILSISDEPIYINIDNKPKFEKEN